MRGKFPQDELGEILDIVGTGANLLVVSDHGFDFERQHHAFAPPGIFFGHGPAFAAAREAKGLSVYDVAPMTLHILGLPLPDDMPETRTGNFRAAVREDWLEEQSPAWVATYEEGVAADDARVESPDEERMRKELQALGYIN